jgi:hypothetical protein
MFFETNDISHAWVGIRKEEIIYRKIEKGQVIHLLVRHSHPVMVNLSKSSLTTTNSGFLFGGNKRKIDIRNFGKYEFFTCRIRKEKGTRETK